MPIANCQIKEGIAEPANFDQLVNDWAAKIGVDVSDITINVINKFSQHGKQFDAMVNLYLPSMWSTANVLKIQHTLSELLQKELKIAPESIFIMTSFIESGGVHTAGISETW